jgi:hypothetical protein
MPKLFPRPLKSRMNDILYNLFLVEVAIVAVIYLSTAVYGITNAIFYPHDRFRNFNLGRGLASLGVVLMNSGILLAELIGHHVPTEAEITIQIAQILYLFGWIFSVRVTLRDGHRVGW